MALYRHIEDAQTLHARVVDACVIDLPVPVAGEDPLTVFREWAVGTRLALLAYPGLGHHLLLHWFELPAMLGIVEGLLELALGEWQSGRCATCGRSADLRSG